MSEPLGEVGDNFSLQLSLRTQYTKFNNKKVIADNQCEKHKKSSSLVRMWFLVKISKADWSMLERLLLLHYKDIESGCTAL